MKTYDQWRQDEPGLTRLNLIILFSLMPIFIGIGIYLLLHLPTTQWFQQLPNYARDTSGLLPTEMTKSWARIFSVLGPLLAWPLLAAIPVTIVSHLKYRKYQGSERSE